MSNQRYSPEPKGEAGRRILEGGHSTSEIAVAGGEQRITKAKVSL